MKFCFHINRRLPAYCEGEVSTNESARIEAHLDECPGCRERARQIRQRIDLMRQAPLLDPPDRLWRGIAGELSLDKWHMPAGDVSPGRRLVFGQKRFLRPAVIAAAIFIIGAALFQAFNAEAGLGQAAASSAASQSDKREVQLAAEFKLSDLDGRQISSADLKGNVVALDFWATWCGPCLAEMPTFNSLHEKYAGRGVKVIGIAVQSGWAQDIKPYRDQYKIAYPILVGDDEVVEKYGVIGFPTTYILDKDLKIHWKFTGKLPGKEELEREIESLLADR